MKVVEYIKDKFGTILFHTVLYAGTMVFMFGIGVNRDVILLISIVAFLLSFIFYTVDYLYMKKKYEAIDSTMDLLENKYLIADVIKTKRNYQEKFYLELVRRACKSMMDELNRKKKQNSDYEEYIENWILEIKTPITAIQLLCDNERNNVTDKIKQETKKVENNIDRMLYYSKIGDTWKDYIIIRTSLKEVVESSIMKIYQLFIYNNVKIDVAQQDEYVYTDKKWSSFIVTQILLNCVQYKSDRPLVIRIYFEKLKDSTNLIIEDNGLGIKEEEIHKIFEKGYVGTNGRKIETSTGMGMFICKRLCDKLGIGLKAVSEYGEYTKMILTYGEGTFYMHGDKEVGNLTKL